MMQTKYLFFGCCLGLALLVQGNQPQNLLSLLKNGNHQHNISFNNDTTKSHSFVLLGASGDLAKREIYPALWYLYRDNKLPYDTRIYGYSRTKYTIDQIREKVEPFVIVKSGEEELYNNFWKINDYLDSSKNQTLDYENIGLYLEGIESEAGGNRIFYLALPPSTFSETAANIKNGAVAKKGWTRLVIEKPFGRDSKSSEELSKNLTALFKEDQIYRMDHFLGYEMVRNILSLRFANRVFEPSWSKDNVAAVEIDFKENFGVEGRGAYFDEYGIIRDVMQNHLLQILTLIAMEEPKSMSSDDIRDAKVALLNNTKEIVIDNVVIGQYIGNPESNDPREKIGYRDDPTVANNSITATFALTVLKIDNERWRGVPFIIRAGKGLNDNRTEVIIQYKDVTNDLFKNEAKRNEVVLRVGKTEALQANIMSKSPGLTNQIENIKFDFDYRNEYKNVSIPEAYERLIADVFDGNQMDFVRSDELREAWRVFTPILHEIENQSIKPIEYKFGTNGPNEADDMENKNDFLRYSHEKLNRQKLL